MQQIKIRKLRKNDFRKGFFETLANLLPVGLAAEEAENIFQLLSANPVYYFLVAESNGEIVGCATLLIEQKFLLKGAKFGHIEDVAVKKEFQRTGIGKDLITALLAKAERQGCCTVRLDCQEKNREFYEKCGFYVKEVMMQKDLRFIKV